MAEYDNTNRGALFKNTRKEKDTNPDYNGSINIEGKEYWLSGWIKDGSKGKFFSLSVKEKEGQQQQRSQSQRQAPSAADTFSDFADDDIPF